MVLPYTHHQLCSSPWTSMVQMQLIVFIASYTLSVFTALTGSTYYIWTPIKLLFRNASSSSSVTNFCMLIHIFAECWRWDFLCHGVSVAQWAQLLDFCRSSFFAVICWSWSSLPSRISLFNLFSWDAVSLTVSPAFRNITFPNVFVPTA